MAQTGIVLHLMKDPDGQKVLEIEAVSLSAAGRTRPS